MSNHFKIEIDQSFFKNYVSSIRCIPQKYTVDLLYIIIDTHYTIVVIE